MTADTTPAECQREFGITNGAWHGAVQRGAIVVRTYTPHSSGRRAAVAELFAAGCSQAEIARELDISRSTVSFHMRRLGVPPKSGAARRYDWDEIRAFYSAGHSAAECRSRFGFGRDCWAAAVRRGEISPRPRLEPLEDILGVGRRRSRSRTFGSYARTATVRRRPGGRATRDHARSARPLGERRTGPALYRRISAAEMSAAAANGAGRPNR
jgi:transposase-like protein